MTKQMAYLSVRRAYVFLMSAVGIFSLLYALYQIRSPLEWGPILIVTFAVAFITFMPAVRLELSSLTLGSVINIFVILQISPWAAIWVMSVEMILITVVGNYKIKRVPLNIGQTVISILLASLIWNDLRFVSVSLAAMVSILGYFISNIILVSCAIWILHRIPMSLTLRDMRKASLSYLSILTLGAIMGMLYHAYGWGSTVVLVILYIFILFMLKQRIQDAQTIQEYADELKIRYTSSIRSLARAIDARDPYTFGHSLRVAEMSKRLAQGVAPNLDSEDVYFGGLLHDVGKIALSDAILLKPGRLEPDELAKMMQHPVMGEDILKDSGVSALILSAVRSHHEWISGGGYPDNMSGSNVPMIGRIVGIADAFDAMVSNRPYRRGCSMEEARERLTMGRDRQFDGPALDAFFALLDAMSTEELQEIGYGQQPPNSSIEPVAELPNSTTTLAERLQAIISQAKSDQASDETASQSRQTGSEDAPMADEGTVVAVGAMLVGALRAQGLDASSTTDILTKLGAEGLAAVVLEAAAGLEQVVAKPS